MARINTNVPSLIAQNNLGRTNGDLAVRLQRLSTGLRINRGADDPAYEAYFPGGSKTIEPWWFGSLTNDQGPPVEAAPRDVFTDAFNRLIVFRGNVVDSNGGIVVRGTSANVLVEANRIEQSDVGVHVNYTTTKGGVVVRNNTEPADVPPNFNPYSSE